MIVEAILHDGTILEFPDDTSPEIIQRTVKRRMGISSQEEVEPAESPSFGDEALGALDAAGQIVSGAIAEPLAGIAGAVTAPFVGSAEASRNIDAVRDFMTVDATTDEGRRNIGVIGELVKKGVDLANIPTSGLVGIAEILSGQGVEQASESIDRVQSEGLSTVLGDRTFDVTGSPILASIAATSPEIAASLIPLSRIKTRRSSFQEEIASRIRDGGLESDLATKMLNGAGKVKTDKLAKEAIKQGVEDGVIQALSAASPATKASALKMLNTRQKGKRNASFAVENRATDIPGNSLVDRYNVVRKENQRSGAEIDALSKELKGLEVDVQPVVARFLENLEGKLGVRLDANLRPVFSGSDIEGLDAPKRAVTRIINRMKKTKTPDAHDMHRLKRFIDENVTYGDGVSGLKGATENVLKTLRKDVDSVLDGQFPKYDAANSSYSETITAINNFRDVVGKKINLRGENAGKAIGTRLRGLNSNIQSRVPLLDSVNELDAVAKKYGGVFNDEIIPQMMFADELDRVTGAAATTSLAGEVGKAASRAVQAPMGSRTTFGALEIAAKTVSEKLRGVNEDNLFKSLREFLERDVKVKRGN